MRDEVKTKTQLTHEVAELRQRIALLEAQKTEHKRVVEELRELKEFSESLIQNMAEGIAVEDAEGYFIFVNPAAAALLGFTPEELLGQHWTVVVPPNQQAIVRIADKRRMRGETDRYEVELRSRSGTPLFVQVSGSPRFDATGCFIGTLAVFTDITERRGAEEALRESETRFRSLVEASPDVIILTDLSATITMVNQQAFLLLGYEHAEEIIGKSSFDFIDPEDWPRATENMQRILETGTIRDIEYTLLKKDGTRVLIELNASLIRDLEGKPKAFTAVLRDITERKQAEEALHQRNRELALLNRTSQAFNSSLDLGEVLVNILEEVRPLLGVIGASIWLNDDQIGELVCQQASGIHSEALRGWRLPAGQGIVGWVTQHGQSQIVPEVQADARHFKTIQEQIGLELHSILCIPLRSKSTVIGALEVVDTTANRFSQTDLTLVESLAATATIAIENARLYEQTRQDAETRAALLEEVNHRVKNNLAAIIGLLHLEQRHMEEKNQVPYQSIMQDLINRIHGLATAHRLLSTANWSFILLSELTTKVIHSALQALPLDKYVSVEVSPSPIQVAPKLANTLALVINELTTNTVKYAWSEAQTGHIAVHLEEKADKVLLEFRDDGPGFPEEVLRLERHSVGWELIQTLVHQGLQGEIILHNDHGAVTTIQFPSLV